MACQAGAEKISHGVRRCIEEHWMDEDFVFFKVDMRNVVSRQAVLDECATFSQSSYHGYLGAMGLSSCAAERAPEFGVGPSTGPPCEPGQV